MSIRDDALAAWERKIVSWSDDMAVFLAEGVLWDDDKNGPVVRAVDLIVEYRDFDNRLIVFTGPSDDGVFLSVHDREPREVRLVELVDGGWTAKSGPLESLADLGETLAG